MKKQLDIVVHIEGRDEGAHLRCKNPEERHAPQDIDKEDPFCKTYWADTLRFWVHVRTPERP